MYNYGQASTKNLETCHEKLQRLFAIVIKYYDISIVCGYRDKDTQDKYYRRGSSKLMYPMSKHNQYPSLAVDFAAYHKGVGISWNEKDALLISGFIEGIAIGLGIKVRIGSRWNHPFPSQNTFMDAFHIELVE